MKFLLTIQVEGQRTPGPLSLKEPAVFGSSGDSRTMVTDSWYRRLRTYYYSSLLGVNCTIGLELTWNFFLATKYCMRLITLMVAR